MIKAIATDLQPDWDGRQRIAADRLDELRRERGVAKLEGNTFDSRQIVEAEAELDAIAAAQVEAERRRRVEQEAATQARRAELRAHITETLDARSKAITEAELAVYKLASAMEQLLATSKDVSRTMQALGHNAPMSMDENGIKLRASLRMAAILGPVCGTTFGRISFPIARGPHLADGTSLLDSWHDSDAKKIASDLSKVITPENNHE
ncbi:hypothetical protein ELI48_08475 [Rhizobium ruizarguesonis]|uniref:hypothetical protein n=1 Tax=Rhizobium ruizarguesonis TaxID=2081791 RepID=UPI0010313BA9|nr:hypothetical protein [Rhizobium ruizarguesonis]TAU26208.1 hypothetical protein ELI48_08475 [Rhizobium ruizarguesonis]